MHLRQMRVFCAIVEEGSFRRASDLLELSQPSVSQHIAALEKNYNVKLFRRSGRGVILTPEGRALYTLGRELLKLDDSIPATFRDMQALQHGSLSLGASHHVAESILPPVLDDFRASFPQISLSIRTGNPATLLSFLKSGVIELALIGKALGVTHDPDLTVRPLGEEELVLVVPGAHPWEGRPVDPAALREAGLLRYTDDHPLALILEDYLLRHQVTADCGLMVDSVHMALRLVALGEYMAIAGRSALSGAFGSGKLGTAVLKGLDEVPWEIQMVYRRSMGLSFAGWEMERRLEKAAEVAFSGRRPFGS